MEIVINKQAAAKRKQELMDKVVMKATTAARKGFGYFKYTFEEDDKKGLPNPSFNISLEKYTNGTITVAYRGISGLTTKYLINEK